MPAQQKQTHRQSLMADMWTEQHEHSESVYAPARSEADFFSPEAGGQMPPEDSDEEPAPMVVACGALNLNGRLRGLQPS